MDRSGFAGIVAEDGACILVIFPLLPAYDNTVDEDMPRAICKPYADEIVFDEYLLAITDAVSLPPVVLNVATSGG